jgi:hypothetical protein
MRRSKSSADGAGSEGRTKLICMPCALQMPRAAARLDQS